VVVSPDGERLNTLVDGLLGAGYRATGASKFAEIASNWSRRKRLISSSPTSGWGRSTGSI
jgi:NAD(P)H-hydrate repair Nnr-like enzyme with NAD(P)H-hydrate epimerase domain